MKKQINITSHFSRPSSLKRSFEATIYSVRGIIKYIGKGSQLHGV